MLNLSVATSQCEVNEKDCVFKPLNMPENVTSTRLPKETNVEAKIESESKQCVDTSAKTETESTVILDENLTTENDDTVVSSVRVVILGVLLLVIGALGFYYLPGMIAIDAKGSKVVNSVYCSVITLTTYVMH
jgi:hypothetical protein